MPGIAQILDAADTAHGRSSFSTTQVLRLQDGALIPGREQVIWTSRKHTSRYGRLRKM